MGYRKSNSSLGGNSFIDETGLALFFIIGFADFIGGFVGSFCDLFFNINTSKAAINMLDIEPIPM